MYFCPNLSNPDVAKEFNELVSTLGEVGAYAVWSLNNGYMVDKAPNGADSTLFSNLQSLYGDRSQAIKAKSVTYTQYFKDWFGDWLTSLDYKSTSVDSNGEPRVLFYESNEPSTAFTNKAISLSDTKSSVYPCYVSTSDKSLSIVDDDSYNIVVNVADQYNIRSINRDGTISPLQGGLRYSLDVQSMINWFEENKTQTGHTYRAVKEARRLLNNRGINPTRQYIRHGNEWFFQGGYTIIQAYSQSKKPLTVDRKDIISRDLFKPGNPDDMLRAFKQKLQDVFGNRFKIVVAGEETWNKLSDWSVGKGTGIEARSANSFIIGNTIYLRAGRFNGQILAEEMLHVLIYNIKQDNPELFKRLLQFAKDNFQELNLEINALYKEHQDEELVTQALSRYVFDEFKHRFSDKKKSKAKYNFGDKVLDLFKGIVGYLKRVPKFNAIIQKYEITAENLAEGIGFKRLTELILSDDVQFVELKTIPDFEQRFSLSNQLFLKNISDVFDQVRSEKDKWLKSQEAAFVSISSKINKSITGWDDQTRAAKIVEYDSHRMKDSLKTVQQLLANSYNLQYVDGIYVATRHHKTDGFLEYTINQLNEDTWQKYRSKYSQLYREVAGVDDYNNVTTALYKAFIECDIVAVDKAIARDYIRLFWNSDLIQKGLDIFNDTGSRTSEYLERALVNAVTDQDINDRINNKSILDYIASFWDNLTKLAKSVFGVKTITDQQKAEVINAIRAAQMWNAELHHDQNVQIIYDRAVGDYSSSLLLNEKDRDILHKLHSSTVSRLKASQAKKNRNEKLIVRLKNQIERFEQYDGDKVEDLYDALFDSLRNADSDIAHVYQYIQSIVHKNPSEWNPNMLISLERDLLGHYQLLFSYINQLFSSPTSAVSQYNKYWYNLNPDGRVDLAAYCQQLNVALNTMYDTYKTHLLHPYAKYYIDQIVNTLDLKDKAAFRQRAYEFLEGSYMYGQLNAGEFWIGMASRSRSSLVRMIDDAIKNADLETHRQTLSVGTRLVKMYNEIRPVGSQLSILNFQKQFMELDKKGVPTGYFIRPINYGQFYKDRDEVIAQLNEKYSNVDKYGAHAITFDDEGNVQFHDDDELADKSIYNQYYDELDDWLDKHSNRRYTVDYYKQRRRYLSRSTLIALNQINRNINLITKNIRDKDGFINTNLLSPQEKKQLEVLRRQKNALSSHYESWVDSDGITNVRAKEGDALRIADELSDWYAFIKNHVKFKINYDVYNKRLSEITDPNERNRFINDNTSMQFTDDFYDLLSQLGRKYKDPRLDALNKRKKELINLMKYKLGFYQPNLDKAGTGLSTDTSMWRELKRIDQEIAKVKRELIEQGKISKTKPKIPFKTFADMIQCVTTDGSHTAYFNYLSQVYNKVGATNPAMYQQFADLFTYVDESGRTVQLSAFSYLAPKLDTISEGGKTYKLIERLPISDYQELDEMSDFVNHKGFDSNDNHPVQPHEDIYHNDKYDKLAKNSKYMQFLNALKSTMDEANSYIPQRASERSELLPQITGDKMQMLYRNMFNGNMWKTIKYMGVDAFSGKYSEQHADATSNLDIPRRPDGTPITNLPVRWVQRLEDPSLITTDVLGSVIMYYQMAANFNNKSKHVASWELLQRALETTEPGGNQQLRTDQGKQAQKLKNILDSRVFGQETSAKIRTKSKRDAQSDKTIQQRAKTIRSLATVALLGNNITVMTVGYADAWISSFVDAIGGKYMTVSDFIYGWTHAMMYSLQSFFNIGAREAHNKLEAAMRYNQAGDQDVHGIFRHTDRSKLNKLAHMFFGRMAGYSLADYMINTSTLLAFYRHFKLVEDPTTGEKKFMSRNQIIDMERNILNNMKLGRKAGKRVWKRSEITLWDAYEFDKDGNFSVKKEYEQYVTEDLKNRMAKLLHDRTSVYNGVVHQSEKAFLAQNIWGSFFLLMRGFFVNRYWDMFGNNGVDYVKFNNKNENISWSSEYGHVGDQMGYENLSTGQFDGAVFKDFIRGCQKWLRRTWLSQAVGWKKKSEQSGMNLEYTDNQRYAVRRTIADMTILAGIVIALLGFVVPFTYGHDGDDPDKDPEWVINLLPFNGKPIIDVDTSNMDQATKNLARWHMLAFTLKLFQERASAYSPGVVMDILSTPSVAKSYIENLNRWMDIPMDIINDRSDEKIKQGGYKGFNRFTKDIFKIFQNTSADALIKGLHVEGVKSTTNFYLQQSPNNFIVPKKTQWVENNQSKVSDDEFTDDFGNEGFTDDF